MCIRDSHKVRHPLRPQPGDDLAGLAAQRVVYTDYPGQFRTDGEVEDVYKRQQFIIAGLPFL